MGSLRLLMVPPARSSVRGQLYSRLPSLESPAVSGLHTGECEVRQGQLQGIALHIAARVAGSARPGTVFVSQTVKDLVAGSGIRFADAGLHRLKGLPEEWRLHEAVGR